MYFKIIWVLKGLSIFQLKFLLYRRRQGDHQFFGIIKVHFLFKWLFGSSKTSWIIKLLCDHQWPYFQLNVENTVKKARKYPEIVNVGTKRTRPIRPTRSIISLRYHENILKTSREHLQIVWEHLRTWGCRISSNLLKYVYLYLLLIFSIN